MLCVYLCTELEHWQVNLKSYILSHDSCIESSATVYSLKQVDYASVINMHAIVKLITMYVTILLTVLTTVYHEFMSDDSIAVWQTTTKTSTDTGDWSLFVIPRWALTH